MDVGKIIQELLKCAVWVVGLVYLYVCVCADGLENDGKCFTEIQVEWTMKPLKLFAGPFSFPEPVCEWGSGR